eukprot:gene20941-22994_t
MSENKTHILSLHQRVDLDIFSWGYGWSGFGLDVWSARLNCSFDSISVDSNWGLSLWAIDITFEYDQSLKKKDAIKVTVEDAKSLSVPADPVKILGRITFTGKQESLHSKGRALAKQECILTDETGSIRFVLWENDISVIASGEAYRIENAVIKRFNYQNYVTLNRESKVHELENPTMTKKDDVSSLPQATTKSVLCPAKGIQNFKKMLTCVKCHRNIIPTARKIIKCCECNTTQLTANCEKTAIVSALFTEAENNRTVLLTNDVLKQILQTMPDCQEDSFDAQDDDLCELLLACEGTISVNMNYVAQLYSPPNE